MKSIKKSLCIVLSLVMALSVMAVAGVSAAASDYSEVIGGKFVLATGGTAATSARVGLGETVYGKLVGTETRMYYIYNTAQRTVTFTFTTNSSISVKVYSATNDFIISETTVSTSYSKACDNIPAGGYYIEIAGKTAETPVEFNFSTTYAGIPGLAMSINKSKVDIVSGGAEQLAIPEKNVENLNYFWTVYNDPATVVDESAIVKVTKDGLVSVEDSEGLFSTDISVSVRAIAYYNGKETGKSCTVKAVPGNVFLEPYYGDNNSNCLTLALGASKTVKATTNLPGKAVEWSTSDSSVATVDPNGKITAKAFGSAIVTARVQGKSIRRDIKVVVADNYYSVTGVTLSAHEATIRAGESTVLQKAFTTIPADHAPTNDKVTYSSSNPAVATVDKDGKVTGVAVGTAKITVTSDDGGYTDSCTVTVNEPLPNWLTLIIAPLKIIFNLLLLILGRN